MSQPFIFIATNKLKEGKLEAERRRVPGLSDFIEASEPRLLAFNEYANEDGTEVSVVQVHPDADSFEFHMGVVRERAERATEQPDLQSVVGRNAHEREGLHLFEGAETHPGPRLAQTNQHRPPRILIERLDR